MFKLTNHQVRFESNDLRELFISKCTTVLTKAFTLLVGKIDPQVSQYPPDCPGRELMM